jgi:hypothetical protein
MRIWRTLLLAAVVLLTGCASLWRVQSDVQSFSSWPQVPQPPTYFRFERLPSQLADPQAQAALEQQALPANGPRGQLGLGFPVGRMPQRGFQRQVSLLLRDLASGQVVYETHARYDSRFTIGTDVLPAMVAAALHGFPQPPTGPRIVTIELPH